MKNILITGARSGIAYHVIQELLNQDYHIYATVHTEKEQQRMKEKYKNKHNITVLKLDITRMEDYKQLDSIDIDIYLANAAIGMGGSLFNMDINKVRENYEVNVFSNLSLLQVILKKMESKKSGRVIMMASLAGILPIPFLGSYCSSKASLIKWMECLRLEIIEAKIPIDVVVIEPGLYRTGFNQVMLENKYPELENGHYFDNILDLIHKQDDFLLSLCKKNMHGISSKICEAIYASHPKFIYRTPFSEVFSAKIYQLFFE